MTAAAREFLESLFRTAVAAAHPASCLRPHLPPPPASGRLILLAAGKAGASMAQVAESYFLEERQLPGNRISGIAVTRRGYACPTRCVRVVEAGHPVPDAAGLAGTAETLALADSAAAHDLVLVLISGGASANWIAPAPGVSLEDKQSVTRALLACGAAIAEINTVRKHLSRIKGGWLARRAHPAQVVTVGISDVPGDDPAVIGSGPTVPDPTTLAQARDRHPASPGIACGGDPGITGARQRDAKAWGSGLCPRFFFAGRPSGGCLPRGRGRGPSRGV